METIVFFSSGFSHDTRRLQTDQARQIRASEELPTEALAAFLGEALAQPNQSLVVAQFPSGYSNLTYLLRYGDTELVLRRPPVGAEHIAKGHDMGREYKVLSLLHPLYPKVPRPIAYTEDRSVIGAPFYVMERVQGVILRANQALEYTSAEMRQLSLNFIENFAQLHLLDIETTGLIQLGKPEGYLQRQVEGWAKRYQAARTQDVPAMEWIIPWLASNMPSSPAPTFLHNDYKYDNIILDADNPTQIKAVLDWEMSTVGDPLTDLGILLSYYGERNDPPALRNFGIEPIEGTLTRQELLEQYEHHTARRVQNPVYYYAFALFKLGVVVQQIYYRYHAGFTKDERFARLGDMAVACAEMAQLAAREQRISGF